MAAIKIRRIDRVVKQLCLLFILLLHRFEAAFFFQPLANQIDDIDAPGVRRVVQRFVFSVRAIVEHRGQTFAHARQKIFADDYQSHAAGTHVLLRARIDEAVLLNRNGPRKNVR